MTMYLEHFGLTEAPFKITPHTEFFFSGASRGETLDALLYAITSGEGIVKVTGEVGAGKTMLCRVLMERLPTSVETIYLAVPSLSRDEMLATIAGDLGIDATGLSTTKLIRALQEKLIAVHAEGKQVVTLVDEAHAMPLDTLEEIRLLSNLETSHFKLMQIVLFGQPELDQHLSLPNMRQLKERITHHFNLQPLPPRDIKNYVDFRLRAAGYKGPELFGADALKLIAETSEGLTRRINIYCDKTLLAAFAAGTHNITVDHARAAISDTQIVLAAPKSARTALWFAVSASLVAGVVIGFLLGRASLSNTPSIPAVPANVVGATNAIEPIKRADSPVATPATISTPAVSPPSRADAARGEDWLSRRMFADAARIATVSVNRFAIQLMTADERERAALENFLRAASHELNADRIMLYASGTQDNPKVNVLYGNYAERSEAAAELSGLPTKVTQFRPYVRSFQAVRDDARR